MSRGPASARVQRMLALIPWVAAHDGPPIEEVCRRFSVSREQLAVDLDVVFLVGTWPHTPDQLIEVTVEDERVWIRYADMFARPLRLTPEEGLGLVAAGAAILAVPGADPDGPLAHGLDKIADVLGLEPGASLEVDFGKVPGPIFEKLQQALEDRHRVRIDYYSHSRDERSTRTVDPWKLWIDQGQWYLRGFCHLAGDERIFRVDRIVELVPLEESFDPPADAGDASSVLDDDELEEVTLELAPQARWVVEAHPTVAVAELGDGRLRATLRVGARQWLVRLLLQLGPQARVTGDTNYTELTAAAARRVLQRYGVGVPGHDADGH